jgi:hypothetical protein
MGCRLNAPRSVGILLAAVSILGASAQTAPSTSLSPTDLVRVTVQNEIKAANNPLSARHMFRSRKQTGHGSETKLFVETKDGMAGLLLATDDRPLTADQRQAEEMRVERFVNDPKELQRKHKREKEDTDHTLQILRALPDAFLYEPDGTVTGKEGLGIPGEELVKLKFHPNPHYYPPSHVEQVLTGMQGYLLIDANRHRIALMDGTLFKEVGFGWGILGHLDKGGHFLVQQGDVGDGSWDATRMTLNFTGKIMMFKNLRIQSDEVLSNFTPVPPNLNFAQGVELLKRQEAVLAENKQGSGGK